MRAHTPGEAGFLQRTPENGVRAGCKLCQDPCQESERRTVGQRCPSGKGRPGDSHGRRGGSEMDFDYGKEPLGLST